MQSIFTRKILVCAVLAAAALGSAAVSSAAETRIYGTVDTGFRMTNVRGGDNTFELVSGDNYSPRGQRRTDRQHRSLFQARTRLQR